MAGLQRSQVSFRRQGSSGLVWDDRFLSGELNAEPKEDQEKEQEGKKGGGDDKEVLKPPKNIPAIKTMERSRSGGAGRGYRTGRVSPAVEPPSPKVSACGFCSAFGKSSKSVKKKAGTKHRSR